MRIGNFDIKEKVFIIAEIGLNHNGDFELAKKMVEEAARCGVDAVKFQTFLTEKLILRSASALVHADRKDLPLFEIFKKLELKREQFYALAELSNKLGLIFLSTPFDETSVDMIDAIVPAFKISSGDLTNIPLIKYIVKKNKPIILSTGMASVEEIEKIVKIIPNDRLCLLHCVSNYPSKIEDLNLLTINFLKDKFGLLVGYSDHTKDIIACMAATTLGARIIEKHFTLYKNQQIGDHRWSADSVDMKKMTYCIRQIEKMMGKYGKFNESEIETRKRTRRSLVAKQRIAKGTILREDMFIALRPEEGISPFFIDEIVGRKIIHDISEGSILKKEDILNE